MKILVIGDTYVDSFGLNLNYELNKFNNITSVLHDYFILNNHFYKYFSPKIFYINYLNILYTKFKLKKFKPNILIVIYKNVSPDVIYYANKIGIKTIHINTDHVSTLGGQEIFIFKYDLYFTKSLYMLDFMRNKLGLNTKFYIEPYSNSLHKSNFKNKIDAENKINIDILFIGTMYPYRMRFILQFLSNLPRNFNISFIGYNDKYTSIFNKYNNSNIKVIKSLYYADKCDIIYGSKIIINNLHFSEFESLNNKFSEILCVGGIQLIDNNKLIKSIYDSEMYDHFVFNNTFELIEKSLFLLDNAELRYKFSNKIKLISHNYSFNNFILNNIL
jgi:spore maturation protein CgeB